MDAEFDALCLRCGKRRDDLGGAWIAEAGAGRPLRQIDAGEDFMFAGATVDASSVPCPQCKADARIAIVRGEDAARIGAYIEKHLWRRADPCLVSLEEIALPILVLGPDGIVGDGRFSLTWQYTKRRRRPTRDVPGGSCYVDDSGLAYHVAECTIADGPNDPRRPGPFGLIGYALRGVRLRPVRRVSVDWLRLQVLGRWKRTAHDLESAGEDARAARAAVETANTIADVRRALKIGGGEPVEWTDDE